MSVSATTAFDAHLAPPRKSAAHALSLALVWLTFALSSVVLFEPAPYDVLMLGLVFLLPLVRLTRLTPLLTLYLGLWMVIAAGGLIASMHAVHMDRAAVHTAVSVYLSLSSVLIATFVAAAPMRHARIVFSGFAVAATIATLAGIAGYFSLFPGAFELFTEHARARGTFKDPNVYGTFLVPVLVYAAHRLLGGSARQAAPAAALFLFMGFGILLSFSRGAWLNAAVALGVYAYLAFVTAPTDRRRLKLVCLVLLGAGALFALAAAALQIREVGALFEHRLSLSHDYDIGPQGRFAGQRTAFDVLLRHPLGLGALEFAAFYHREDVHNVYLSMFLNAGWIGGLAYFGLVAGTLTAGARHALRRTPTQGLTIVAVAALAGMALEGLIVDSDHWRHFYALMGLIWGLIAAGQPGHQTDASRLAPGPVPTARQAA